VLVRLVLAVSGLTLAKEQAERVAVFAAARRTADARGKPLLNVGCPCSHLSAHGCGDVCLDADPRRLVCCRSTRPTVGDVRSMPQFADRSFGAVTCFHVLEHLPTVADAERALGELARVADDVFLLSPARSAWINWAQPEHRLWVNHERDGAVWFEQRDRGAPDAGGLVGPEPVKALWLAWQGLLYAARTGGAGGTPPPASPGPSGGVA
jgi:hypothetical protein